MPKHFFVIIFCLCWFGRMCWSQEKFDCASRYYSDTNGLTIKCYAYPLFESKLIPCFKDMWWKMLPYSGYIGPGVIVNPFELLGMDVCQKKCLCSIEFTFMKFSCINRGRPPAWSKSTPPKRRSTAYCRRLTLPKEINDNSDDIVLTAQLSNLWPNTEQNVLLGDLFAALGDIGIKGLTIRPFRADTLAIPPLIGLSEIFHQRDLLSDLTWLHIGGASFDLNVSWPEANAVFGGLTRNLKFLLLDDLVVPSISPPPFVSNLVTLACVRCSGLIEMPSWLKEAQQLQFLHLSRTPGKFSIVDMPPLASLLHFGFSDCPLKTLPETFDISTLYPNLENLDLSNLDLAVVPRNLFKNLKHLLHIDLSGNTMMPLPSFEGLTKLKSLQMDSIPVVYSRTLYFNLADTVFYGPAAWQRQLPLYNSLAKRLTLRKGDFQDLVSLEILTLNNYVELNLDDEIFANTSKLKVLYMNTVRNMYRLPGALKYVCNLQELSANTNPINNITNYNSTDEPDFSTVPLFIPKYFKNLRRIDLTYTNMSRIPIGLLLFDLSKASPLLQWITDTIMLNPAVLSIPCEIYKYETAFGLRLTTSTNLSAISASCDKEYKKQREAAMRAMETIPNFCLRSAAGSLIFERYQLSLGFIFAVLTAYMH